MFYGQLKVALVALVALIGLAGATGMVLYAGEDPPKPAAQTGPAPVAPATPPVKPVAQGTPAAPAAHPQVDAAMAAKAKLVVRGNIPPFEPGNYGQMGPHNSYFTPLKIGTILKNETGIHLKEGEELSLVVDAREKLPGTEFTAYLDTETLNIGNQKLVRYHFVGEAKEGAKYPGPSQGSSHIAPPSPDAVAAKRSETTVRLRTVLLDSAFEQQVEANDWKSPVVLDSDAVDKALGDAPGSLLANPQVVSRLGKKAIIQVGRTPGQSDFQVELMPIAGKDADALSVEIKAVYSIDGKWSAHASAHIGKGQVSLVGLLPENNAEAKPMFLLVYAEKLD